MDIEPHPFAQLDAEFASAEEPSRYRPRARVLPLLIKQAGGYSKLARALGTSPGYLHDIAHARRNGSMRVLEALAIQLGVEVEDIAEPVRMEGAA